MPNRPYPPETIDRICEQLEAGASLRSVCAQDGMPSRNTVWRWSKGDDEIAQRIRDAWELGFLTEGQRIRDAWELGYLTEGERIYEAVLACEDPHKGKTMLEAAKWHLGHRSMAYANKPSVGVTLNVAGDDALAAVRGALDRAAAAIAGGSHSTQQVALPSPAGSGDAARDGLADLDGSGGKRLGEDEDRG